MAAGRERPEAPLATGKRYHRKATCSHQVQATDAPYFKVVGWGYYYVVTSWTTTPGSSWLHRPQAA